VALLAVSQLPLLALFALLVALSAMSPAFDSARGAALPDILPGEAYPRGSALANLFFQSAQIGGFLAGGALLAATSARQALLLDAGTFLFSAGVILATLAARPLAERAENSNLLRETVEGFRIVMHHPALRSLLAFALVGAMAVSAPEALAVPVAHAAGGDDFEAGLLTATIPAGFVLSSLVILRLDPVRRMRTLPWLVLLSAVPLLATPFVNRAEAIAVLWLVAGLGSAQQLVASAAYVQAAPNEARARAYGIASTLLVASQGVAQLAAGGLATFFDDTHGAAAGVAILAALTLCALPLLMRYSAGALRVPQENSSLSR
jgi:MFS family permease